MEQPGVGWGSGLAPGRILQSSLSPFHLLGLSGPSLEDGVGLFLSAFLLLGLIKALGWAGECAPHCYSDSPCLLPEA